MGRTAGGEIPETCLAGSSHVCLSSHSAASSRPTHPEMRAHLSEAEHANEPVMTVDVFRESARDLEASDLAYCVTQTCASCTFDESCDAANNSYLRRRAAADDEWGDSAKPRRKCTPSETHWNSPPHAVMPTPQHLPSVNIAVAWFNSTNTAAVAYGVQAGATCGLHAFNHCMVSVSTIRSQVHSIVCKTDFEHTALTADLGDAPANLVEPGGSNYDIAAITCNFTRHHVATPP